MSGGHTPGPWFVSPFTAHVLCQDFGKDGELLPVAAMLWPTDERSEADTQANARLIAAAPDLLAAAAALIARWPTDQHEDSPLKDEADALRAAIARTQPERTGA